MVKNKETKKMYTQCRLIMDSDGGIEIAWIPDKFAKKGQMVLLGKKKGKLAVVDAVFAKTKTDMAKRRMDYPKMKERTDI